MKKIISILLSVVLTFSCLTISAFAETDEALATHSQAIVIIPGIAGSKLQNSDSQLVWLSILHAGRMSQLACTETGSSINTISLVPNDTDGVLDSCKTLYNSLSSAYGNSYDVIFFPYDWRMSCTTAASRLTTKLSSYSNVIIVAHSMGGLVASKFLMSSSNRSKVSKYISLGTPYTGSVKALYMMETGEFVEFAGIAPYKNTIKSLVCNFPAIYELLPSSRYLSGGNLGYIKNGTTLLTTHTASWNFMKTRSWGKKTNGTVKPMFSTATTFHNSLLVNGTHITNSSLVNTYKIYGTGEDTLSRINYATDGTISVSVINSGDGTVCAQSATNAMGTSANRVYGFLCTHMQLAKETSVINKIKAIINGTVTSNQSNEISTQIVNEKGWIVGCDNKRTNIIAHNVSRVNLYTDRGFAIKNNGNSLYYIDDDENQISVGTVWSLGDNSYQFIMKNGNYSANIEKLPSNESTIRVEYTDSGYYTKSIVYNNIDTVSLYITDSQTNNVRCVDKESSLILPSTILSQAELDVLNQ